ncbi:MAG: hypothetical protein QX193_01120 [Methylococcales bacterium]|nr:hypothetical protein [Methylococcales bacterium]
MTTITTNKYKNSFAFAAIKTGGAVVSWGNEFNASSKYVPIVTKKIDGITDVKQIYSTDWGAFAALKNDGSVVTWGSANYGGDSSKVSTQLNGTDYTKDVTQIYSTAQSFAALRKDGSVVTWGNIQAGGGITAELNNLQKLTTRIPAQETRLQDLQNMTTDVKEIYSTGTAFAALKNDGSVVTWGNTAYGGKIPTTLVSELDGKDATGKNNYVTQIFSTNTAFAALRADGSVVTWGNQLAGGDSKLVAKELNGTVDTQVVTQIFSTYHSFAALRKDGSVVTWGSAATGGDSTTDKTLAAKLNGTIDVVQIYSTDYAFSALRADGSVVTWGGNARLGFGGDSSTVKDLTGVIEFSDSNNRLLTGKATNDTLIGGLGLDTLTGGLGSDTFKFNNINETGITVTIQDIITDFNHSEGDKIDFSAIDANSALANDQAFNFVGSANFTKQAGELHFTKGILEGDTNGDAKADFSIKLNGVTDLVSADFVL